MIARRISAFMRGSQGFLTRSFNKLKSQKTTTQTPVRVSTCHGTARVSVCACLWEDVCACVSVSVCVCVFVGLLVSVYVCVRARASVCVPVFE